MSGIVIQSAQSIDVIWEIYWAYVEASVAIIMASLTAFRSFFITRGNRFQGRRPKARSMTGLSLLRKLLSGRSWRRPWTKSSSSGPSDAEPVGYEIDSLPEIPRPHMTGIRTFIRGAGVTRSNSVFSMRNNASSGPNTDVAPLWSVQEDTTQNGIRLHHEISMTCDRVSLSGARQITLKLLS